MNQVPDATRLWIKQAHSAGVTGLAVDPTGNWIFTGSSDGKAKLFDLELGEEYWRVHKQADEVYGACFTPGGKKAVFSVADPSWQGRTPPDYYSLRVYNVGDGSAYKKHKLPGSYTINLAVAPDGRRIYCVLKSTGEYGFRKGIAVVDIETGSVIGTIGDSVEYRAVDVGAKGNIVAAIDWNDNLHLIDANTGSVIHALPVPDGNVSRVSVSDASGLAATSGRSLWIFDLASGQAVKRLGRKFMSPNCAAFSPDGKKILEGRGYYKMPGDIQENCGASVWDIESGRELERMEAFAPVKGGVAFSPGGGEAVLGDDAGMLSLWRLAAR